AFLATAGDAGKDLPDVGLRLVMLAPVPFDRNPSDQVPGQKLFDRVGDVRTCETELVCDGLRSERTLRQIEQGMDLAHRAVHPPMPAHIAPLQDELLDGDRHFRLCGYFCHDRNIGTNGRIVKRVAARSIFFTSMASSRIALLNAHRYTSMSI